MALSSNQFLQENQLVNRIQILERAVQQLRTAQTGGSDVLGPTIGAVTTTNNYTLTTSFADVTDMSLSITPAVASTIIVAAVWDFDANGAAVVNDSVQGQVDIDSSPQTDLAYFIFRVSTSRATVGNVYVANL